MSRNAFSILVFLEPKLFAINDGGFGFEMVIHLSVFKI